MPKIELPGNWVCDGKELKPKAGAAFANTWQIDAQKAKPKTGASLSNSYDVGRLPILAISGQLSRHLLRWSFSTEGQYERATTESWNRSGVR